MALGIKSFKSGWKKGKSSSFNKGMTNIGRIATSRGTGRLVNQRLTAQSKKVAGVKKGFKKFMGVSNKAKGRFLRGKVKTGAVGAAKFFKKSTQKSLKWTRKKTSLLLAAGAAAALAKGRSLAKGAASSVMKKGFNPIKFILLTFVGWIITKLPEIMAGIKKFLEWAKPAFKILGDWVKGIVEFFKWIGGGVMKLWDKISGNTDKVDAEKKKLEDATGKLKKTFDDTKKGHEDLVKQAKGEETNLNKDMDDLNKEVNQELDANGQPTTNSSGKDVTPSTTISPTKNTTSDSVKPTSTPKTKLASRPQRIGTGKPVTVVIKGESVVLQPGTVEYNTFFGPGGTTSKIMKGTLKDMNLVQTKSGPKIVTVDIPLPANKPATPPTSNVSTQGSSDGVNSKELALHSIER